MPALSDYTTRQEDELFNALEQINFDMRESLDRIVDKAYNAGFADGQADAEEE